MTESDRKLRLFGCSCCRRIWNLLTDERSRKAVEVAELYADGDVHKDELKAVGHAAWAVSTYSLGSPAAAAEAAAEATWSDDGFGADYHVSLLTYNVSYTVGETESEAIAHRDLRRDITGNPLRPVFLDHTWQTATVSRLARAAYEERIMPSGELDPARLAVLSDALEEAGCDDAEILNHLRSTGPHVRGCWVLDLLLGKE